MPEEQDNDEIFGGDDPSTMVVGSDDARHREMIDVALKARGVPPAPASAEPPTANPRPSVPAAQGGRAAERSSSGTIDVPVAKPVDHRLRNAFVLGVAAIAGVAAIGFALHWW